MEDLYHAENRLDALKQRATRCCCKYCGQPLTLKRIMFSDVTDARIEIYCEHCERIEYGIEPEIYQSAKNFVENLEFNYYTELDQNEKTHRMNIAKVAEIIAWGYRSSGLLDDTGFKVAITPANRALDQCLIITETELLTETEESE